MKGGVFPRFSRRACSLLRALIAATLAVAGCAAPPASHPTTQIDSAIVPSTQPVVGSCDNSATVEFGSSWSNFRFADQSNAVTINLTAPAPPAPPPAPIAPVAPPLPTGAASAQADRGGATPDALRGAASADALRGSADASALRGSALAQNVRGSASANLARGSCTVQVLRGNVETVAAHHANSSAVVRPDLSVTLSANPAAAAPGDTVVYTITIKNISTIAAREVTITDYLPPQLQAISARGATVVTDPDDSSTHLSLAGEIAPGGSTSVQLLARVKERGE